MTYVDFIRWFWKQLKYLPIDAQEGFLFLALLDELNEYWLITGKREWVKLRASALMDKSRLKKNAFYRARNKLKQLGLIDYKEGKNRNDLAKYYIPVSHIQTLLGTLPETLPGTLGETLPETLPGNNNIDIDIEKEKEYNVAIEILDYLNEKANKRFKPTKGNLKYINARLKEKYKKEDFFKVIDLKVNQWINDSKMKQYLRPSTLFNSEKFDAYLNESLESNNDNDEDLYIEYPYGG